MLTFSKFTTSTNDRRAAMEGTESFFSQNVSTPTRLHFWKRIRMLALLFVCLAPCLMSYAQTQRYAMYPQTQGKVEQWKLRDLPSWLSLDGQVRLRTEDFTSFSYIPGNDRIYELTRIYGGLTVRPTSYLTGYMQFMDAHALGLPVNVSLESATGPTLVEPLMDSLGILVIRPTRTAWMSSAPRLLRLIPLRWTCTAQD